MYSNWAIFSSELNSPSSIVKTRDKHTFFCGSAKELAFQNKTLRFRSFIIENMQWNDGKLSLLRRFQFAKRTLFIAILQWNHAFSLWNDVNAHFFQRELSMLKLLLKVPEWETTVNSFDHAHCTHIIAIVSYNSYFSIATHELYILHTAELKSVSLGGNTLCV